MTIKLLLADDSITIQKLVELIATDEGFEIKATNNGEEALSAIPSFQPDIVLADTEMPAINGYQLCEKIKQDPIMHHIPVILLTGAFEPIDDKLVKQVRADDVIIKPFEPQELISKLKALLTISVGVKGAESAEAIVKAEAADARIGFSGVELPSRDELKKIFESIVNERISSLLSTLDIKEAILTSLIPLIKDSVEQVTREIAPGLVEKILKDTLTGSIESLTREIERALWETVPDLAEGIISKEIERIRSEF
jgi:CheY-like chemotaxis protein